jgi:hypothetical protein
MPPEITARVQKVIQGERDPKVIEALIVALKQYPKSDQRDLLIGMLKALVLQIEQANIARKSLEDADEVMNKPTGAIEEEEQAQAAAPAPSPTPAPKSEKLQAAEAMSLHIRRLQSLHGYVGAKWKEDRNIVKRFQNLAGLNNVDGVAGPVTLTHAAASGHGDLPRVMYWPKSSNRYSVQRYRDALRKIADDAEQQGHPALANQMRMSANVETGQSGIVNSGPALT